MPLVRLFLNPGIDKQNTEYGAEGGWINGDYIRFRYGLPEKLGGWATFNSNEYLLGQATDVFSWKDNQGSPYAALATNRKIYVFYGGGWYDITPLRGTTATVTFDTQSGSDLVTVNDTSHGAVQGDFVTISGTTGDPGGIPNADLNNEFEIQTVLSANAYTILAPSSASSTASAAGSADADYQINVGPLSGAFDFGWGTGTWGALTWGTPRPQTIVNQLFPRVWQFDAFGENLLIQQVDGSLYEWLPSLGVNTRATIVAGAPTKSKYALVSTPDRHLVCLGTEDIIGDPTSQDPLFVRFSNQEDINTFEESATNTAGGQKLTDGNFIVTAVRSRGQILIWTDTALHGMQFVGPPYTFGFQQLGANCGCISPHGAIDVNGVSYWMADDAFWVFDGTAKKLPCTVQDYVFKDINLIQGFKVCAGLNTQFNEVTWFYCSITSDFVDRFVSYNYLENVWSIGSMARTAWMDEGVFLKPTGVEYFQDSNEPTTSTIYGLTAGRSQVYAQETGFNQANGDPIFSYIQSGYFDIADGENMLLMSRFIPDFKNQLGNLTVRLLLRAYPQATASPSSLDPYEITPTTQKVDTRARGRQISLKIESDDVNTNWRFGTMRVYVQPDGLR